MSKKNLKVPATFTAIERDTYMAVNDLLLSLPYDINNMRRMVKNLITYKVVELTTDAIIERVHLLYTQSRGVTLQKLKLSYGDVEGLKRWNEYCDKQSYTNTYEYKSTKHGMTKDEYDSYNKSRAVTIENMVKKHGQELGTQKYIEYCERQAYTNTLDYFVTNHGRELGEEMYIDICERKAHTLNNMIQRYGETTGTKVYKDYVEKKSFHYTSKEEMMFSEKLIAALNENGFTDGHHTSFGKMAGDTYYVYDYVNTRHKILVEYNGSIWHANPLKYKPTDQPLIFVGNNKTAQEIWNNDKTKTDYLVSLGVVDRVFYVWDTDRQDVKINEILNHLQEYKEGN